MLLGVLIVYLYLELTLARNSAINGVALCLAPLVRIPEFADLNFESETKIMNDRSYCPLLNGHYCQLWFNKLLFCYHLSRLLFAKRHVSCIRLSGYDSVCVLIE